MRNLITYLQALGETLAGKRRQTSEKPFLNDAPNEAQNQSIALPIDDKIAETVELEITTEIDLHTFAPRDIPNVVRAYLEEARARNFCVVRIVHGKGKGVQRAVVRKILDETAFVESYADAAPYSGGWGATLVRLRRRESATENL